MIKPSLPASEGGPRLLAVSDLHVAAEENRAVVDALRRRDEVDWLIVAGDVAEISSEFARTMSSLTERFARVVWAPGNHELWSDPSDRLKLRGEARYRHLVDTCRSKRSVRARGVTVSGVG